MRKKLRLSEIRLTENYELRGKDERKGINERK